MKYDNKNTIFLYANHWHIVFYLAILFSTFVLRERAEGQILASNYSGSAWTGYSTLQAAITAATPGTIVYVMSNIGATNYLNKKTNVTITSYSAMCKISGTGGTSIGLFLKDSSNVTVSRLIFSNFNIGIRADNTHCSIASNSFQKMSGGDWKSSGIFAINGSPTIRIFSNYFTNINTGSGGIGIYSYVNTAKFHSSNNILLSCKYGFVLEGVSRAVVKNNVINFAIASGIELRKSGTTYPVSNIIAGNSVRTVVTGTGNGISATDIGKDNLLSNNIIQCGGSATSKGIYLASVQNVAATNRLFYNQISGFKQNYYALDISSSNNLQIYYNKFISNDKAVGLNKSNAILSFKGNIFLANGTNITGSQKNINMLSSGPDYFGGRSASYFNGKIRSTNYRPSTWLLTQPGTGGDYTPPDRLTNGAATYAKSYYAQKYIVSWTGAAAPPDFGSWRVYWNNGLDTSYSNYDDSKIVATLNSVSQRKWTNALSAYPNFDVTAVDANGNEGWYRRAIAGSLPPWAGAEIQTEVSSSGGVILSNTLSYDWISNITIIVSNLSEGTAVTYNYPLTGERIGGTTNFVYALLPVTSYKIVYIYRWSEGGVSITNATAPWTTSSGMIKNFRFRSLSPDKIQMHFISSNISYICVSNLDTGWFVSNSLLPAAATNLVTNTHTESGLAASTAYHYKVWYRFGASVGDEYFTRRTFSGTPSLFFTGVSFGERTMTGNISLASITNILSVSVNCGNLTTNLPFPAEIDQDTNFSFALTGLPGDANCSFEIGTLTYSGASKTYAFTERTLSLTPSNLILIPYPETGILSLVWDCSEATSFAIFRNNGDGYQFREEKEKNSGRARFDDRDFVNGKKVTYRVYSINAAGVTNTNAVDGRNQKSLFIDNFSETEPAGQIDAVSGIVTPGMSAVDLIAGAFSEEELADAVKVDAKVLTPAGVLFFHRTFVGSASVPGAVSWNLEDPSGNSATGGIYLVRLTLYGRTGEIAVKRDRLFIVIR